VTGARDGEVSVHGTIVVVGEAGILVRGGSGTGKSRLAQALIDEGRARARFARLVSDDRVRLVAQGGRLLARSPERTSGMIEERGSGLLAVEHEAEAVIRCVVDLDPSNAPDGRHARLPDAADNRDDLRGVDLPRIRLDRDLSPWEGAQRVLRRLERS
jgi:HPr kinase/phosphorylase